MRRRSQDVVGLVRQVQRIFQERLQRPVEDPDLDLVSEGLLDSLAFVDLLVALEAELGVEVRMEEVDFDDFRSVRSIASWVARQT